MPCISTIRARRIIRASIVIGTLAKVTSGARPCAASRSHPKLRHAAFILETPYDDPRADLKNLAALRSFVNGEL